MKTTTTAEGVTRTEENSMKEKAMTALDRAYYAYCSSCRKHPTLDSNVARAIVEVPTLAASGLTIWGLFALMGAPAAIGIAVATAVVAGATAAVARHGRMKLNELSFVLFRRQCATGNPSRINHPQISIYGIKDDDTSRRSS